MHLSIRILVYAIVLFLAAGGLVSLYLSFKFEHVVYLSVAGANILGVLILVFLITRGILKPLDHIRTIVEKIGAGNFTLRITRSSMQEMELLGQTLNEMVSKVQKERIEVEQGKRALEAAVQSRTKELQELALSLEQKITVRTKELEEKVRELERFQKLAVGRELKMIELKHTIKELEDLLEHKKLHTNGKKRTS